MLTFSFLLIVFSSSFSFADSVKSLEPQILLPYADDSSIFEGSDWLAVPALHEKKNSNEVRKGTVKFIPAKEQDAIESGDEFAIFTPEGGKQFSESEFSKYTYVRRLPKAKEGPVDLAEGTSCLYSSTEKKTATCILKLKTTQLKLTEKLLEPGVPLRLFTIHWPDGEKLEVEASSINFAGDLNHDGGIDLIFENNNKVTTTKIYLWDSNQKKLKLVATQKSDGH